MFVCVKESSWISHLWV